MNPTDSIVFDNQNQTDPKTPGSLNFVPATPESVGEVIENKNEVASILPENNYEKQKSQETYKIPQPQAAQEQQNQPLYHIPVVPVNIPKPQIVDKTKDTTPLHSLQKSTDSLTKLADLEEEEFISDVEAAHGHK